MAGCLCGGSSETIREHFHGDHHQLTLSQRLYLFANIHKQSICLCTIALAVAIFLILKKK